MGVRQERELRWIGTEKLSLRAQLSHQTAVGGPDSRNRFGLPGRFTTWMRRVAHQGSFTRFGEWWVVAIPEREHVDKAHRFQQLGGL